MKNCKTFYETQTASRLKEIIQSPPHPILQDKNLITFLKQDFLLRRYTETYRHLLSKSFKNAVLGGQEMVQFKYFSDTKQKHV